MPIPVSRKPRSGAIRRDAIFTAMSFSLIIIGMGILVWGPSVVAVACGIPIASLGIIAALFGSQ